MGTTVNVTWLGEGTRFAGEAEGGAVRLSSELDAERDGPCPMDLLLVALGGCTGMDVAAILQKMRQPLESFRVEVHGAERDEDPQVWTDIEVVYHLAGDLDEDKVRRAIELSEQKYCCVEAQVCGTARIRSRYEIRGPRTPAAP